MLIDKSPFSTSGTVLLAKLGSLVIAHNFIFFCPMQVASAQNTFANVSPSSKNTSSTSSSTNNSNPSFKITVQKVELGLEELRDIGLDLKHLLTSCSHLYDEVTLQPVSINTQPEMIANGVIISLPVGTTPVGPPAPPRKERVDMLMNQIRPVIKLLKQNVDDFVIGNRQLDMPDNIKETLSPQFDQWVALVNQIAGDLTQLETATVGPPYDNYAIASLVNSIQEDVKKLEKIRRTTYKAMRKEGKQIRK